MNVGATNGVGGLEAFLSLVNDARVRNGGFEVPVARTAKAQPPRPAAAPQQLKAAGSLGRIQNGVNPFNMPEKPRQILGTRFDTYA